MFNFSFRTIINIYMNQEEFKEFMAAQTEAIEVAKWLIGEKLGRDPGQEFVMQWIKEHGQEFRDNWFTYSAEWHAKHKI